MAIVANTPIANREGLNIVNIVGYFELKKKRSDIHFDAPYPKLFTEEMTV